MNKLLALLFLIVTPVISLAQFSKSAELDQKKSLESRAECLRIKDWNLLNAPDLEINCLRENHTFLARSKVVLKSSPEIRIGNFNLLHPGMDKTIFKDFDLVVDLIDGQFDVMAGIELVDVIADAEKKNIRLRPLIEEMSLFNK